MDVLRARRRSHAVPFILALMLPVLIAVSCGSWGDAVVPATSAPAFEGASVDSTGPKAYLPYRLEATAGATTIVVFRVEDETPQVTVTLRLQGPVDKTFTRIVKTNEDVRWTLAAKLKGGRYHAFLSAVDTAGKSIGTMASRTMIVNPRPNGDGSPGLSSSARLDLSSRGSLGSNSSGSGGGSGDYTVYVTDTGDRYHAAGCQYLSESSHPISLMEASADGYEPCSVCNP